MIFDGYPLTLGADGLVPRAEPESDTCCADPLCIDFCVLACSFIDLLPTGPMWDRPKMETMAFFNNSGSNPCEPACPPPFPCPSLVLHAIYAARRLLYLIEESLWPAIRESDPYTAVTTIDDWLERMEWEDCYRTHCRSVLLGDLTPYEIEGECGPIYCPPDLPDELECAVKRGILIALQRANRGVIKNLAGLNWIIEPLGAELRPRTELEPCEADYPGKPSNCDCGVEFEICNVGDTLPGCQNGLPDCGPASVTSEPVQAFFSRGCDVPAGLPQVIWPGVIAAECIVRSLMPRACPNIIHRCC